MPAAAAAAAVFLGAMAETEEAAELLAHSEDIPGLRWSV